MRCLPSTLSLSLSLSVCPVLSFYREVFALISLSLSLSLSLFALYSHYSPSYNNKVFGLLIATGSADPGSVVLRVEVQHNHSAGVDKSKQAVAEERGGSFPDGKSTEVRAYLVSNPRYVVMYALNCLPSIVCPQLFALNCLPSTDVSNPSFGCYSAIPGRPTVSTPIPPADLARIAASVKMLVSPCGHSGRAVKLTLPLSLVPAGDGSSSIKSAGTGRHKVMDSSFSFFRYNVFHSVVYNRTTTAAEEAAEEKRESREAGGTAGKEKKPSKESLARQGLSPVHEALFPTYASPAAKGRESEDSSDFKNEDIGDSWTTVCPLLFALYCLPSTVCLSQLSACLNCLPCSLN